MPDEELPQSPLDNPDATPVEATVEGAAPPLDPALAEPEPAPAPAATGGQAKPKRRKIDLKSRLSSVRGTGAMPAIAVPSAERKSADPLAFPPPPVSGAVPAPKLPGGILASSASSPFAPPEPEKKVSAQQQTIKVEMGEEVVQQRKKTRKRWMIYLAITAVVGLGVGFQLGALRERGQEGYRAVAGAKALAEDIKTAGTSMSDLSDGLRTAVEALAGDEYPDALGELLKKTNVPFAAENFSGKGVGGLPPEILKPLLEYTSGVAQVNKKKDILRNLLSKAKPQVLKFFKEKKKPVINFSVLVSKSGNNAVALLVPNKEPFENKSKWPETYTVVQPAGKKTKEVEVKRYVSGKMFEGDVKKAIPIDEKSVGAFTSRKLVFQLKKALADTKNLIDGIDSPIPSRQTDGLLKEGERLQEQLRKIGAKR